jgi:hypothetical protein
MSHEENQNIISLVTTLLVSIPYFIFIFQKYQNANVSGIDELVFWASAILLLIPLRIVSEIIISILFEIGKVILTGKEGSTFTDERDKLIELKSQRNSFYIFMLGIMLSMLMMVTTKSVALMFGIIMVSGFMGEIFEILSKIYYYNKGI